MTNSLRKYEQTQLDLLGIDAYLARLERMRATIRSVKVNKPMKLKKRIKEAEWLVMGYKVQKAKAT